QRIEGFDISNISGTFAVASMVSFRHGRPDRANYRRFKIKTVEGQDDFACVAEVVRRRYTRVLNESKVQSPQSGVREAEAREEGAAVAAELQTVVDDVSAALKGKRSHAAMTDAAAADVRAHRAAGLSPKAKASLPDLILIDGGKGQLSAACRELERLGLSHV